MLFLPSVPFERGHYRRQSLVLGTMHSTHAWEQWEIHMKPYQKDRTLYLDPCTESFRWFGPRTFPLMLGGRGWQSQRSPRGTEDWSAPLFGSLPIPPIQFDSFLSLA